MVHVPAYLERFFSSSNAISAGEGGTALTASPLLALIGICVIGLLLVGGLWLKGRPRGQRFRWGTSRDSVSQVAAYDHVTGLPTKRLFETLLEQAVSRASRTGRAFALFIVQLDHFRMVAEGQGQANCNVLVRVQAARVKGALQSTDTVARLVQDQFAMIADNVNSPLEVATIAARLHATVGLPLTLDGHELFMTCRIGVALYPQDAPSHTGLIEQAMRAVKIAKAGEPAVRCSLSTGGSSATEPMPVSSFAGLLP